MLFAPGEGFHYSSYGYTLLSLALESASSMTFEGIMYKEVFTPVMMANTKFDKGNLDANPGLATPYLHVGQSSYGAPDVKLSYKHTGGGHLSSASDMARFGNVLLGSMLLTEELKDLMWSPVVLVTGEINPENYGLGFRV